MGLLVAGVAMAGSAFTNVKSHSKTVSTVYVYAQSGTNYLYDQDDSRTCSSGSLPCQLDAVSYTFDPSGSGTISQADVNNSAKINIATKRSSF